MGKGFFGSCILGLYIKTSKRFASYLTLRWTLYSWLCVTMSHSLQMLFKLETCLPMSFVPLETVSKCANIKHQASFMRTAHSGPHKLVKKRLLPYERWLWPIMNITHDADNCDLVALAESKTAVNSYSLWLVYIGLRYDALKWPQVRIPIRLSPSIFHLKSEAYVLTPVISHSSAV